MKSVFLSTIVLLTLLTLLTSNFANALTQAGNEAKQEIFSGITRALNGDFEDAATVILKTHDNKTIIVYNQSEAPPTPPPVVCQNGTHVVNGTCVPDVPPQPTCGVGEFYNTTSQQCQPFPPQPPLCLPNQIFNQTTQQCQDLPPPTPLPSDRPTLAVNISKTLRVMTIGDIDLNSGLDAQLALAVKYHAQVLIVIGDYGYKDCQKVVDKIHQAGFDKNNAVIIQGNHDCSAITKAFNGWNTLYGNTNFPDGISSKFSVFAIDGNSAFDCSSTQFKAMQDKIRSSDAWYNIPAIHQPFVTVKSDHGPNGQFACWDALFRENGITDVLQAHNHNYQRIEVNGVTYYTFGTGTHDTGSSMYPISSNNWNGFDCQKCITGTNGITLLDFQIDDPHVRNMQGWFISNNDEVKDKFN